MSEKLSDNNFDEFINAHPLTLIDFYSDSCIPCKMISPLLSKAEVKYAGKVAFAKVNSAMNEKVIERYEIQAAPTLVLIKDGEEVARHRGVISADELDKLLDI